MLPEFYGIVEENHLTQEQPLPEIGEPFVLVFNAFNWKSRHLILQRILSTIAPHFRLYVPQFDSTSSPSNAEREFLNRLRQAFDAHGLGHIEFRFSDCLRRHLAGL